MNCKIKALDTKVEKLEKQSKAVLEENKKRKAYLARHQRTIKAILSRLVTAERKVEDLEEEMDF